MIAVALLPGALMAAGGTASGTLTVQGQTIQMKYAYAVQIPDFFDKSKVGTRLLVSDAPVSEAAVQEDMDLMSLSRAGKINAVQFEFGAGRSSVSISVLSNKLGGSLSVSKGFDPKSVPVFTATRMEGTMAVEPSKLGPMTYQYNIKFATPISPRVVAAEPTPSDAAAASKSNSAQAYLAFVAAVRKGDKAKMLELASPRVRQMMDTPDFSQNLAMVQAMLPAQIQVLKATETGDEATLLVKGTEEGKTKRGTVTMLRQGGKWFIVKESWKSA
jgi:hypothetical protein